MSVPEVEELRLSVSDLKHKWQIHDGSISSLNDVVFGSEFKRRPGMVDTVQEHDDFIRSIKAFNSSVVRIGAFVSICMVIIIVLLGYNILVK